MPYRETVRELAEALADICGIYSQGLRFEGMTVQESQALRNAGSESGFEGHAHDCWCRLCWTGDIARRMRAAVRTEENVWLFHS